MPRAHRLKRRNTAFKNVFANVGFALLPAISSLPVDASSEHEWMFEVAKHETTVDELSKRHSMR
jgi:hypothetical protein